MKQGYWTPFHRLGPLDLVVVLYNIATCQDADCDAVRTQKELLKIIELNNGGFSKTQLESALYCCNINDEDEIFWHPYGKSFDKFLVGAIPRGHRFDKYYNLIEKKKEKK